MSINEINEQAKESLKKYNILRTVKTSNMMMTLKNN